MFGIARLRLSDFRSYATLDLESGAQLVALAGENGAGKTNILEAISLFAPGRGLRRASFVDMARIGGSGGFSVAAFLHGAQGDVRLGIGLTIGADGVAQRQCRIDREDVPSASAFADHLRQVWLTPELDGIFRGPAGDRRRFLDRLVLAVDSSHAARATSLERVLRSRNKLLEENGESRWLDAIEREIAELAIAVTASRMETVRRLAALIGESRADHSPFPWADIDLVGDLEAMLVQHSAAEAEERFRAILRESRARDRAAGRTLVGPQSSDLAVRHGPKAIEARLASTGEQKALLVGLVLAHARLVFSMSGIAPLVLLDEVSAHLDPHRRAALFEALTALGGQVWVTGAEPSLFQDIGHHALRLIVRPGEVARL